MPRLIACLAASALSLGACRVAISAPGGESKPGVYEADFQAFVNEVDSEYPFLELKGTREDWTRVKNDLAIRSKNCASDSEFLSIIYDAIHCLRDAHMAIADTRVPVPQPPLRHYPGISFLPAAGRRVVVMHPPPPLGGVLKTGTVVTAIDGREARRYLDERAEKAWKEGGHFSSPQRARLYEYRLPLRGEKGTKHTLRCLVDGREQEFVLVSEVEARGWPHRYNPPAGLKSAGRSFHYTKLPGDIGYLWIRRIDETTPAGIAEALAAYPDLKGWVADLRGNGGGGYGSQLIEKLKTFPRPTAVLIDAGCMSAGETLARDFVACCDARLFGEKTAGASSAKRTWKFPSGAGSVVFPVRSRWRSDGSPIEFNGIEPDAPVEAVPEELIEGKNSEILRAAEYIEATANPLTETKADGREPARGRAGGRASPAPDPGNQR